MEESRRKERYFDKINFILDKIENIPEFEDDIKRDAAFYRMQIAIEASMDIVAMLTKDVGGKVGDDYANITFLTEREVLSKDLGEKLKELNGLRNVIVHKYNKVEEELIEEKRQFVFETLNEFVEVVENVIKKIFE
ncbi:MAG: DUF86 domain-containing protein [Candidatus Aenigmatarchaeota archaeon]|nr:MAG: DUF86 domain-containing protein [Candidatus Aenigmarchaeota archaeon]